MNKIPYARHYNLRFIYFLPTFWSPKTFFQGAFFLKFWPYVWLVFKSGFWSRAGYDNARTVVLSILYWKFFAQCSISVVVKVVKKGLASFRSNSLQIFIFANISSNDSTTWQYDYHLSCKLIGWKVSRGTKYPSHIHMTVPGKQEKKMVAIAHLVCLFVAEEILYSIERERTMAHYCTHLCQ